MLQAYGHFKLVPSHLAFRFYRLMIHRLGQRNPTVDDSEIERIISLKSDILTRILIRDYILPPRGGEYRIHVLQSKLDSLFGENPTNSFIYHQLNRVRDSFLRDGRFQGPLGN
ncbi:hypothetical protein ERO13_A13G161901v2 [Gossypium hirsutum]|nr:hypothetical protein ERO13_A13G161901v2 [Gossypium hirsutum]